MAEYYQLPAAPRYHETDIRKLQDSDPASASTIFNPLIDMLLENTHFVKLLADTLNNGKANKSHSHAAGDVSSGVFDSGRLPTVPVAKGGTGAADAANARANLGITLANLGAAAASHTHTPAQAGAAAASHTHDDRYFTETEVNNLLKSKAAASHTHTKVQITDMPAFVYGNWTPNLLDAYGGGFSNANVYGAYYRIDRLGIYICWGDVTRSAETKGTLRMATPFGENINWGFIQLNQNLSDGSRLIYAFDLSSLPWVWNMKGQQLASSAFTLNTTYHYWALGFAFI